MARGVRPSTSSAVSWVLTSCSSSSSHTNARVEDGSPGRRYGAFVLDRSGKLEWSDVGPAAPIDSSVRDLLTAANDWSVSVLKREGQAVRSSARTAQDALADLSTRVWSPLRPLLEAEPNARRLRIAPDALLNLVPFDALSDGRDLIERFAITYLPAGRDLSVEGSGHRVSSAPVVLVSPGVDTSRDRVHDTAASAVRTRGLAHLAAAAEEAAVFRRLVPRADLYAAADATESRLKGLHGPALLHIVGTRRHPRRRRLRRADMHLRRIDSPGASHGALSHRARRGVRPRQSII